MKCIQIQLLITEYQRVSMCHNISEGVNVVSLDLPKTLPCLRADGKGSLHWSIVIWGDPWGNAVITFTLSVYLILSSCPNLTYFYQNLNLWLNLLFYFGKHEIEPDMYYIIACQTMKYKPIFKKIKWETFSDVMIILLARFQLYYLLIFGICLSITVRKEFL